MDFSAIAKRLPWARGVAVLACDANGLIAVEKPAGALSHPNKKGDLGKALLKAPYDEGEQAYAVSGGEGKGPATVYLLNRLDSATSGIVLLSLCAATAAAMLKAFEAKRVKKTYHALVFGAPRGGSPVWRDRITVRKSRNSVRASTGGGVSAETRVLKVEPMGGMPPVARLTLMPITGRTHQLRIQTAQRHVPIVGDRTYGDFQKNKMAAKRGLKRLCLHCVETELEYQLGELSFAFRAASKAPF